VYKEVCTIYKNAELTNESQDRSGNTLFILKALSSSPFYAENTYNKENITVFNMNY
jgi:hypothetical protein